MFLFERKRKVFAEVSQSMARTPIQSLPEGDGFDTYIIENIKNICTNLEWKLPEDQLDPKVLRIGIQIIKHHASLIIEELHDTNDVNAQNPLILTRPVEELQDYRIPATNFPRQLHIRFKQNPSNEMVLAFDKKNNDLCCPRYIGICCVFTSWKMLQCIALRNCLQEHSIILDDCATFAKDIVEALLRDLLVDNQRIEQYMKELGELIVIIEESARVEASSREVANSRPVARSPEN
ncbi:hypothetical protein F4805DRAFT_428031 [Annulohypoxylon moriforme]|nr:hypothetical protein F4805DRAFT_428031 [Annulohypoxylon moriforme]